MAKYLAIFTDNLEGNDINGFVIMTEKEVDTYEHLANSITWEIKFPMEDLELIYADGEELLSKIEFKEISQEEYKVIKKLFNLKFGFFIDEEFLINMVNEEEDFDDEDEEDDDNDYYDKYDSNDDDY